MGACVIGQMGDYVPKQTYDVIEESKRPPVYSLSAFRAAAGTRAALEAPRGSGAGVVFAGRAGRPSGTDPSGAPFWRATSGSGAPPAALPGRARPGPSGHPFCVCAAVVLRLVRGEIRLETVTFWRGHSPFFSSNKILLRMRSNQGRRAPAPSK